MRLVKGGRMAYDIQLANTVRQELHKQLGSELLEDEVIEKRCLVDWLLWSEGIFASRLAVGKMCV